MVVVKMSEKDGRYTRLGSAGTSELSGDTLAGIDQIVAVADTDETGDTRVVWRTPGSAC